MKIFISLFISESGGGGGSGMVFGIPLSQCVNNDRLRRLKTANVTSTNGASDIPVRDDKVSYFELRICF